MFSFFVLIKSEWVGIYICRFWGELRFVYLLVRGRLNFVDMYSEIFIGDFEYRRVMNFISGYIFGWKRFNGFYLYRKVELKRVLEIIEFRVFFLISKRKSLEKESNFFEVV